jgi:hypothetical protein
MDSQTIDQIYSAIADDICTNTENNFYINQYDCPVLHQEVPSFISLSTEHRCDSVVEFYAQRKGIGI